MKAPFDHRMDTHRPTIRRAIVADAAALAAFAARTFDETFGPHNRPGDIAAHLASAYSVAQQTSEIEDADAVTLLAHADGALVAYAQIRRQSVPACVTHERPVELYRFYIDRPAQGTGVAQRLMAAVFDEARRLDGAHVWLGVWERNARAIRFYAKAGFADIGSKDFFVGEDRQTDRVMVAPVG